MSSNGGFILGGLLTGGVIFLGDMVLKPMLKGGLMEILCFAIEGALCEVVYHVAKKNKTCGLMDNITLQGTAVAGIVIWLTDFLIRPESFTGVGMESIKFFLQGFIVYLSLGYVLM